MAAASSTSFRRASSTPDEVGPSNLRQSPFSMPIDKAVPPVFRPTVPCRKRRRPLFSYTGHHLRYGHLADTDSCRRFTGHEKASNPLGLLADLVAGAGFEPATFRL